jgi:hypothetical protein
LLPEKKQGVKKKPDFLHLEWRKSISSCRHCLVIASFAALLLVLFCTVRIIHAGRITLEWDPVPHPDLAGYMVYYGTFSGDYDESVDVGNWTSVTIEGLEEDETYYFSVTAYSVNGGESEYSNEVCNNSAICDTASSSGGRGGCFIATAAHGSYVLSHVKLLGEFRDQYLLTKAPGKSFFKWYYNNGPHAANHIEERDWLKPMVRVLLMPLVGISYLLARSSLATVTLLGCFLTLGALIFKGRRRRA